MSDITLEKTHALLEKLAEYVMNEVPTRREMNARFENIDARFVQLEAELQTTKTDVQEIKMDLRETRENIGLILDGMDVQTKQLDIIRIEQVATNAALLRHEKRITALEEKVK